MARPRPEELEAAFRAKLDELFRQPVSVSNMEDLMDVLRLRYYYQSGTLPPEKAVAPIPGARGRRKFVGVAEE